MITRGDSLLAILIALLICTPSFGAVPADPIEKIADQGSGTWNGFEAKMSGDAEIIYAECYGPFALIGRNKDARESRQLYNLADQKLVGNIAGKFDIDKPMSLSPDGKYFAAWRGFFAQDKIAIFDQKGKPFTELKSPAKVEGLQFLADGKLASFTADKVTIWDIPTKKALKSFRSPKLSPFQRFKPMLSPNGKVSLIAEKNIITYFDDGGNEIAKFTCPKVDDFFESDVIGIAYHPDGKTLAIYLNTIKKNGFCLLDVTTGEFKGPYELEQPSVTFNNDTKVIDWSPDGKAIVLRNQYVVDPESGKVIWSFPEPDKGHRFNALPARLFGINRGIYADRSGDKIAIKGMAHDEAKIAEIIKAARSGVKVTDALLPKLTETTLTGVKTSLIPATPVAWTAKSDPAGDASKLNKGPITLDAKADLIDRIFFTPPAVGLAFLDIRAGGGFRPHVFPGHVDKTKSKQVEVVRLSDGLRAGKVEFGFDARFRTASLDGKFIVVSDPETGERLDLLSVEKGEPLCAFRPFHQEGQPGKRVTFVRFVSDNKLLTGNGTRYAVWNIPDCKADAQVLLKPHAAALSANAKLLAAVENDAARVFDSNTLSLLGDLEMPNMNHVKRDVTAVSFHPDGNSLLAAFQVVFKDNSNGVVIAVWDLATGKGNANTWAPGFFGFPSANSSIEFAGKEHFLLNKTQLISIKRNEVIWSLHPSHQMYHAENSPDGRLWYTARTDPFKEGASLLAVEPADPKILDWVKAIESAPNVLWKPGTTVSVSVQLPNVPANTDPQKGLEGVLTRQGMKIGAGNATLTVTATERATDRTIKYRDLIPNIRQGLGEQTVNVVEVVCVAQLSVNGTVVWQGNNLFSNAGGTIVNLPPNENDVAAHLTKSMWAGVASWAGSVTPPKLIVQTRDGVMTLPGMATFTGKGLEVQPPIVRIPK